MTLIDTHAHIYLPEFTADRGKMLLRAKNEGVSKVFMPAIDAASHAAMLALENEVSGFCLAMMGLHPCSVKENYREELKIVRKYLEERSFIAVGEIGLDFYWDKTFLEQQYAAFHKQIEWALEYAIPVSIHSRNATEECIAVMGEYQKSFLSGTQEKLNGVFHCFSGTVEQAQKVIELGLYLGIGGVVTFKNAGLDKVLETVPLESLILETDAPYLAPVPFRGKTNEPSYLKYVVQKLSEIKGVEMEEIAAITTANAKKLFGI